MSTQTADTNVTQTSEPTAHENTSAPTPPSPAIARVGKSLDALLKSLADAGNAGAPDTSDIDAKLTALSSFADDPTFQRAIADLEVQKQNRLREHQTTVRAAVLTEVRERYADEFRALSALISPVSVTQTARVGRPTNAERSERTIARSVADIQANPKVEYIGAPLADIAAIGHECSLTSVLTNGARRKANLAQQMTLVMQSGGAISEHAACLQLATQTCTLFGTRAQLNA